MFGIFFSKKKNERIDQISMNKKKRKDIQLNRKSEIEFKFLLHDTTRDDCINTE